MCQSPQLAISQLPAAILMVCIDHNLRKPNIYISLVHRRPWRSYLVLEKKTYKEKTGAFSYRDAGEALHSGKSMASQLRSDSNPDGKIHPFSSTSSGIIFIQFWNPQKISYVYITALLNKKLATFYPLFSSFILSLVFTSLFSFSLILIWSLPGFSLSSSS